MIPVLELLKKLRPCVFKYTDDPDQRKHFGLIAQEINDVLDFNEFAVVIRHEDGHYAIRYNEFVAVLIKAVQVLTERIEKLEKK